MHIFADSNHLGFGFNNEKNSVSIPFTSYNNLIIVKAEIDGQNKLNLILDTGIRSLVVFDKSYIPKVSDHTFEIKFTGAGSESPIDALVSINHNLRLCDEVVANQINTVILKRSNKQLHNLKGLKIHGAFGYQLFSRFQVKINYKQHLLTLSEPDKKNKMDGFEAIPIKIHDTKPFIETSFLTKKNERKQLNLMLDLGANHKILFYENPYISDLILHENDDGRIAEGLSNTIYGIKATTNSIQLGTLIFTKIEILIPTGNSYQHESLNIEKHGALGGAFFNKSTIVLDYINGFLFVESKQNKPRSSETSPITLREL